MGWDRPWRQCCGEEETEKQQTGKIRRNECIESAAESQSCGMMMIQVIQTRAKDDRNACVPGGLGKIDRIESSALRTPYTAEQTRE
jgi:hypothetical protein